MPISDLLHCDLTFRERVQFAWQLAWPVVLIDVAWSVLLYVVLGRRPTDLDGAYVVVSLLLVFPFVVRRALRMRYPGYRIGLLRDGAPADYGYTESFKVMWLLSWRTSVLFLGLLLIVSLFGRFLSVQLSSLVPKTQDAPFLNAVGVSVLENGVGLVLQPLVVPGMLSKQYKGFRLALQRITATQPVSRPAAKQRGTGRA